MSVYSDLKLKINKPINDVDKFTKNLEKKLLEDSWQFYNVKVESKDYPLLYSLIIKGFSDTNLFRASEFLFLKPIFFSLVDGPIEQFVYNENKDIITGYELPPNTKTLGVGINLDTKEKGHFACMMLEDYIKHITRLIDTVEKIKDE